MTHFHYPEQKCNCISCTRLKELSNFKGPRAARAQYAAKELSCTTSPFISWKHTLTIQIIHEQFCRPLPNNKKSKVIEGLEL